MNIGSFRISKKLTATILTSLLIILNDSFALGIPQESIMTIAGVVASYLFGQSTVDKELVKKGLKNR